MKLDLFTQLLDTFGAHFRRWPGEHRRAGETLRDTSLTARKKWEAALRLDTLFALDRGLSANPIRTTAITNAALRRIRALPERTSGWRWLFSEPMGIGAALAAMVLAGWLAGIVIGPGLQQWPAQGVPVVAALLEYGSASLEE